MPVSPSAISPKVLVAEEDPIVSLDLQGMLMRLGYDVVALVDNPSAILIAVRRFVPDIVLLSSSFSGGLDGISFARNIQEITDIPIVFCVSSPDLAILTKAKEIAFSGYLIKPINPDSLATTVDMVLYKYKLQKRVQEAEEKFKQIAARCEVMQYFLEENTVFRWELSDTGSVCFDVPVFSDFYDESILNEAIKAEVHKLRSELQKENFEAIRIFTLEERFVLHKEIPSSFVLMVIQSKASNKTMGLLLPVTPILT